jgi:hypothetical protein
MGAPVVAQHHCVLRADPANRGWQRTAVGAEVQRPNEADRLTGGSDIGHAPEVKERSGCALLSTEMRSQLRRLTRRRQRQRPH